ncbi:hypothetical protein [Paraburkholderia aromaticivorans]|uniref:hypothetical protein n=1 Tax=Paraburkholderia aromaticivorans TaxID=2026199 RepID=UPI0014561B30|nr:hypothetical protein [Paraburkholderia aromaticivorans]
MNVSIHPAPIVQPTPPTRDALATGSPPKILKKIATRPDKKPLNESALLRRRDVETIAGAFVANELIVKLRQKPDSCAAVSSVDTARKTAMPADTDLVERAQL